MHKKGHLAIAIPDKVLARLHLLDLHLCWVVSPALTFSLYLFDAGCD